LLVLLSRPSPIGHSLRGRVQKRKTEYDFLEGKNGFNCVSWELTGCDEPADAAQEIRYMADEAEKRGHLIRHLEEALALADEIEDGQTGFLIERAIDEARSRQFRPMG
jgi:hypothetical protein